jgi:hypothetical protein
LEAVVADDVPRAQSHRFLAGLGVPLQRFRESRQQSDPTRVIASRRNRDNHVPG